MASPSERELEASIQCSIEAILLAMNHLDFYDTMEVVRLLR